MTGDYPNMGVASCMLWPGWFIGCVGHNLPVAFYLAVEGALLSYIYSAPPLKNGWVGNFALDASYISLPWWAGQTLFGTLTPDIVFTLLYSIAGLGIAIVNDFKSIEGDRALGLQSIPVAFGVETAKWICVVAIDITQLSIAGNLHRRIPTEENSPNSCYNPTLNCHPMSSAFGLPEFAVAPACSWAAAFPAQISPVLSAINPSSQRLPEKIPQSYQHKPFRQ
ncbi:hypothetical protein Ancab_022381 [Ancistrocladus abbreviatus]